MIAIRSTISICVFLILLLLGHISVKAEEKAPDNLWKEERAKDGIVVYTRKVAGSKHKAVRAEMTIPASLNALVGLIRDTSSCSEFASLCKEARELEVVSETELYVYSYNDIPWPVSDRDAVSHVVWSQDPMSLAVEMEALFIEGMVPALPRAVRITSGVTRWFFTPAPVGSAQVEVVSEAHIDPMGPTPAWLINILLVEAPIDTMKNIRRIIGSGKYSDVRFDFITEPK